MNGTLLRGIGHWLKLHYDKILAVLMLVVLGLSLLYLAVKIGMTRKEQEAHARKIEAFRPAHPHAVPLNETRYEVAVAQWQTPFQLPVWTNTAFSPEARVWCVDCRMPIPWAATVCPFCTAQQPPPRDTDPLWDSSGDGIPDLWKIKMGLDPRDPSDVLRDSDGDGFINLVEFMAEPQTDLTDLSQKHGTDINDPEDYPPPEDYLVVRRFVGDPFHLRFLGKSVMPDDSLKFQLNVRGAERTVWASMGDTVEGFTLVDFKEEQTRREQRGVFMLVDESILTLQRGETTIPLQIHQLVPYTEYTAHLEFVLDQAAYEVKIGSVFRIRDRWEYRVTEIDREKGLVVLIRVSDGERSEIGRTPAGRLPPSIWPGAGPAPVAAATTPPEWGLAAEK